VKSSIPDRLHAVEALRPLQAVLDSHPDAVFISDGGEFGQWAQACLSAPNRIINGVAGPIGVGLPFAIGARLAVPGAPVVVTLGDGTFGFHPSEIDTAVRYGLPESPATPGHPGLAPVLPARFSAFEGWLSA